MMRLAQTIPTRVKHSAASVTALMASLGELAQSVNTSSSTSLPSQDAKVGTIVHSPAHFLIVQFCSLQLF